MDKIGPVGLQVGQRLKELRRARGYTLGDVEAKLAEIGRPVLLSALSKIEKGQRRVDVDDLVALARVLKVSPGSLLLASPTESAGAEHPEHRVIVAVDAVGLAMGSNSVRVELRHVMYD